MPSSPQTFLEVAHMTHYHIRWTNSELDWEAFPTRDEAETEAERLKRLDESYTIEELDGDCQRCKNISPLPQQRINQGFS